MDVWVETREDGGGKGDPKGLVDVWVEEKTEEAPSSPSIASKDILLPGEHAKSSHLGLAIKAQEKRGLDSVCAGDSASHIESIMENAEANANVGSQVSFVDISVLPFPAQGLPV